MKISTRYRGRFVWSCLATLALATGCSHQAGDGSQAAAGKGGGGVAIVDLDQIAKRIGQDAEMARSIEQASASLNDQLKSIRDKMRVEYQKELAKLAPADDQADPAAPGPNPAEAAAIKQRYDQQLAQLETQAREKLMQHRVAVVERFRSEVRPVAEKVARARGQGIVVTKNDSVVFAFLPQADITDAVVEQMQSQPKSASAAASTVKQASHTEEAKR